MDYRKLSEEQRKAFIAKIKTYTDRYQSDSLQNAENHGQFWSEEEDLIILTSELSLADVALQLGRTFYATTNRRKKLLDWLAKGELPVYSVGDRTGQTEKKHYVIACACATLDRVHEPWCPVYQAPTHLTTD